jgi:hypothetical protein
MHTFARRAMALTFAALASLALIASGCGSSSENPGVAQVSTASTTTQASQSDRPSPRSAAAFSACMRSHGVPDFPDPKVTSGGDIITIPDSDSPRFGSALKICQKFLPDGSVPSSAQQRQELDALLRFAACMRAHGVPNFPDPTVTGGRTSLNTGAIDRGSPRFAAAKKACGPTLTRVTAR